MLGFTYSAVNDAGESIAYWSDSSYGWNWAYSSIIKMLEEKDTTVIELENHGGYPNIYSMNAEDFFSIIEKLNPPIDLKPAAEKLELEDGVTIEIWDQS